MQLSPENKQALLTVAGASIDRVVAAVSGLWRPRDPGRAETAPEAGPDEG